MQISLASKYLSFIQLEKLKSIKDKKSRVLMKKGVCKKLLLAVTHHKNQIFSIFFIDRITQCIYY